MTVDTTLERTRARNELDVATLGARLLRQTYTPISIGLNEDEVE